MHLVHKLLKLKLPGMTRRVASMRSGCVSVNRSMKVRVESILMDSGALHSSYVSQDWVDKHRLQLQNEIRRVNGYVSLGDNVTRIPVKERILLSVEFVDWDGDVHQGVVDFCVYPAPGEIMIVGLPDIIRTYLNLFIDMLKRAREDMGAGDVRDERVFSLVDKYPDLISPWTTTIEGETLHVPSLDPCTICRSHM